MMIVTNHLMKYGPSGVPNGRVLTQNLGNGITPCLIVNVSMYLSRKVGEKKKPGTTVKLTLRIHGSFETAQSGQRSDFQTR